MFQPVHFCAAPARQFVLSSLVSMALVACLSDGAGAAVRMILNVRPEAESAGEQNPSEQAESALSFLSLLPATLPDSSDTPEHFAFETRRVAAVAAFGSTEHFQIENALDLPGQQTALQLLHGGAVSRETAVSIGRHAVRLQALEQAARRLSTKPAARLFTDEIPRLIALCAAMYRLDMGEKDLGPGTVRVFAHVSKIRDEEPVLRGHIATGQSLDFQVMAYSMMRDFTAEALRLVRDAAILRRENGDDSPQAQRLDNLLARMDTLGAYLAGPFPPDAQRLTALRQADPGNPVFLLEEAAAQLRASYPANALNILKKLDDKTADSPQALYLLGLAELSLRLPGLALRNLSSAVALAPEDPTFWEARAGAYNALGDAEAMCRDLRQSCTLGLCTALEEARRKGACLE